MQNSSSQSRPLTFLIQSLITFSLLVGAAQAADPARNGSIKADPAIQKVLSDLEHAIQDRDFRRFDTGNPEEKPITWGLCGFERGESILFDEAAHRLSKAAEKATISVSEAPLQAYYVVIETHGWPGENPYRFFLFEVTGGRWRWSGIKECEESVASRTAQYDFDGPVTQPSVAMDDPETPTVQNLVDRLKGVIASRNFMLLRPYVPNKKVYGWTYCGPGDSGIDEYYFDGMQKKLLEYSGSGIYIDPDLKLDQGMDSLSIETEGWLGEYPFFLFSFGFNKTKKQWELGGVCYSRWPELHVTRDGEYYKEVYVRKPDLPRPGPRVFHDVDAFHVRVREIINQKAFEALRPYALKGILTGVTCDADMTDSQPNGKALAIEEVISRLREAAEGAGEIKFHGVYGPNRYLESTGWSSVRYVYFGFTETPQGWEWTKIAFCKAGIFDLVPMMSLSAAIEATQETARINILMDLIWIPGVIVIITLLALLLFRKKGRGPSG